MASSVRQALATGVIDEFTLDVVPGLLGSRERLFDGVESFGFDPVEVLHSPHTSATGGWVRRRSSTPVQSSAESALVPGEGGS